MSEEIASNTIPDIAGDGAKPKRQLTEAQRLAFLKARETRARNIAIRREQKVAEEAANPPPEKKPRAKRAPKRDDGSERQRVKVQVNSAQEELEVSDQPAEDLADEAAAMDHTEDKEPISSLPEMPDPHLYAKLVADIIYDKLNAEIVEVPPPPKPKLKRTRNNGRRQPHVEAESKIEASDGHPETKATIPAPPEPTPTPTPTVPSLAWM